MSVVDIATSSSARKRSSAERTLRAPTSSAGKATTAQPSGDQFSAAWLMAQTFPEVQYVVAGIVPEGLSILASAPKTGKSWLMLDLALAASIGGPILGSIPTGTARPVLYLALEDGPNRLQRRLRALGGIEGNDLLDFATVVPADRLIDTIRQYMAEHPGRAPLVILDTLGRVMPPARAGESDYQRDYRVGSELKRLADANPGAAIIVVHHTRKADSDDYVTLVSGTNGLAGAADTVMVLRRRRAEETGVLSVTSRDAVEGEYLVRFADGRWTLDGASLREAAAALATARATERLGELSAKVIGFVNEHPEGVRAAQVSEALQITPGTAAEYLRRAANSGRIERAARGVYAPATVEAIGDA